MNTPHALTIGGAKVWAVQLEGVWKFHSRCGRELGTLGPTGHTPFLLERGPQGPLYVGRDAMTHALQQAKLL